VPYQASLDYSRAFQNLFRNTGGVKNGFAERLAIDSLDNKDDLSREAILDNLMFGTPDMVVKKLRQYEAVGTDIFLYGMSFGLPHKHAKRSLELFIKNVMPHFTKGKGARAAAAQ
jgi:alkanesulfonate monooxygenase SsuD/methylene tetrahydromethanopterin reductase-like flavin-dependent oxidoreductase (luciferase family)